LWVIPIIFISPRIYVLIICRYIVFMANRQFMELAIQLATATVGQTSPNPSVGAVIVKNNQIVGIGSHLFAGSDHAEIHALNMAGELANGATLYITLEPCVHFGKTPPCTSRIINAGIKTVVIATRDLNPEVAGRGIEILTNAGIKVEVGLLEAEAKQINRKFFHYIKSQLPYITIKAGLSIDGKLATKHGESQWITNIQAREDAHYLRHKHDAILVGVGTVLADDPSLTTRIAGGGKNPIRIILDTHLRTPLSSKVILEQQSPTYLVIGNAVTQEQITPYLVHSHVKIIQLPAPTIKLTEVLAELGLQKITSLLVEGGSSVINSFLQQKLINQLVVYISPMLIGGINAPAFFQGCGFDSLADSLYLKLVSINQLDDNLKIVYSRE
ncbi:MAG: bifunctional diaminohydroxyphosphoribosylaminopyrimidine deaminase/5-amino-6-(5-phosphoribosylamino)uracil reductase RibD, partial [Burkholderiales bacterium]|nr:bifunctional diaminohydroxyphosphoribosylaminopyrimidine deaminase/5-amino-6-(5-phosphoribosylamino)uracil reductase RibD [Burkholderiales bacterium]